MENSTASILGGPKPLGIGTAAGKAEIDALTGLRGGAAMLITVYHYLIPLMAKGSLAYGLLGRGYIYVDLYFILSGYVLSLNYGSRFSNAVIVSDAVSFFWKRFARVYPLYASTLGAITLGYWLAYHDFNFHEGWIRLDLPQPWADILISAWLMQAWGFGHEIVGQAWSICTEFPAYFTFPWLVLVIARRGVAGRLAGLGFGYIAVLVAIWLSLSDGRFHAGALDIWGGLPAFLRCFGSFSIGVVLGGFSGSRMISMARTDAFGFGALCACAVLLISGAPDAIVYLCFPAIVLCLAINRSAFGSLFGCMPMYVLGVLSYPIYLFHVYLQSPMFEMVAVFSQRMSSQSAWIASFITTIAALLVISAAAHFAIERPCRNLLRSAGARRSIRSNSPLQPQSETSPVRANDAAVETQGLPVEVCITCGIAPPVMWEYVHIQPPAIACRDSLTREQASEQK